MRWLRGPEGFEEAPASVMGGALPQGRSPHQECRRGQCQAARGLRSANSTTMMSERNPAHASVGSKVVASMINRPVRSAVFAAISVAILAHTMSSAAAAPNPNTSPDAFVRAHPEAVKTAENVVSWDDGRVDLVWPLGDGKIAPLTSSRDLESRDSTSGGGVTTQATVNNCPDNYSCFYENRDFGGRRLQFTDTNYCQDLRNYGFNDATSSWVNNRNANTFAFADAGCTNGMWLGEPYSKSAYVGASWNDRLTSFQTNSF